MGQLFAVEVIYRGVFQKTLAKNITRDIVLAAHNEGKLGISFGRYGDAPERNGIPAKSFAIVADDEQTLEAGMAQYEPKQVDLTVVLDDTLCKGVESWAWYGLQPVHHALKPGRTLVVVSLEDAPALLENIHRREEPYKLGAVKGIASFSGMWVFKDDHTDVRILGIIAKALPEVFGFKSVEQFINEKLKSPLKVASARQAFDRFTAVDVRNRAKAIPTSCSSLNSRAGKKCAEAFPSKVSHRADLMKIRSPETSAASGRCATSCSRNTRRARSGRW